MAAALVLVSGCAPPPVATSLPRIHPVARARDLPARHDSFADSDIGVAPAPVSVCARRSDGSLRHPVPPGQYRGLLRHVRCDQQKFLTMARFAKALGVDCDYCHLRLATDPNQLDYRAATNRKRLASWMRNLFIEGLRGPASERLRCSSCHLDRRGTPAARFLGAPRDQRYTQRWMHADLTAKLRQSNGARLRCKTCHVGMAPSEPGWRPKILLQLSLTDDGIVVAPKP